MGEKSWTEVHERHCLVDEHGIAHVSVALHDVQLRSGDPLVLASIAQPFCAYDPAEHAVDFQTGKRYEVHAKLEPTTGRYVRFVLQPIERSIQELRWDFYVSCAIPFLKSDLFFPPEEYWQQGGPEQIAVRSYVLGIRTRSLRYTLEFEGPHEVMGAPAAVAEYAVHGDFSGEQTWERVKDREPRLRVDVAGKRVTMQVDEPEVGNRYGIAFKPLLGDVTEHDAALDIADQTRRRCRSEAAGRDTLTRAFESALTQCIQRRFASGDLGNAASMGFLWNTKQRLLEPTFGTFPYENYAQTFRFGCGVAGHAFRFGRPAFYCRERRSEGPQLIYQTKDDEVHDWIVCLPLRVPPSGVQVGVVSFSGRGEPTTHAERELRGVARKPELSKQLKELYAGVNAHFWEVVRRNLSFDSTQHAFVERLDEHFGWPNDSNHRAGPVHTHSAPVQSTLERARTDRQPPTRDGALDSSDGEPSLRSSANSLAPRDNLSIRPSRAAANKSVWKEKATLTAVSAVVVAAIGAVANVYVKMLDAPVSQAAGPREKIMDRIETVRLLRAGPTGLNELRRRLEGGVELPSLEGQDLSKCNLDGMNFRDAVLSRCTLIAASLEDANLRNADLRSARLIGAHLARADLSHSKLQSADLHGADLRGADLSEAVVAEADLTDAQFSKKTILNSTDLSRVVGLTQAQLDQADCDASTRVPPALHLGCAK